MANYNILTWNVRGLNCKARRNVVRTLISDHNVSVVCLLETKLNVLNPFLMGETILDLVIQVANGEVRTKAEQKAQEDFIPWKRGVSL